MLVHLILSQRFLKQSSILFILFSLSHFSAVISTVPYFHNSIFHLTYLFYCLSYSATDSFWRILNFTNFVVTVWLFFISSRSLLNVLNDSYISSILFSRFWMIFTIITLNFFQVVYLFSLHLFGLVGFYLVPSFAQYFSVFSFYLTYCVWVLPSPGYRVIVPLIFGLCPWWVRLILWFVQASHWERLVPAFWKEEVFFPLSWAVWGGVLECLWEDCWWLGLCPCPACCLGDASLPAVG